MVGGLGSALPPPPFFHAEGGQGQPAGFGRQDEINSHDSVLAAAADDIPVLDEDVHIGGKVFHLQPADLPGLVHDHGLLPNGPIEGQETGGGGGGLRHRQGEEIEGEVGVGVRSVDLEELRMVGHSTKIQMGVGHPRG